MIETRVSQGIVSTYFDKLQKNLELDVAIVGGGPSGIVAAYYLAKAGLKVAQFDRKLAPGGGADLVNETMETINRRFESYFPRRGEEVLGDLDRRKREELVLVTREYLLPYLRFIRDNKKVYRAAFRAPASMQVDARYGELKQHILGPILERFEIPAAHRPYYMVYYVEGIAAIVKEWLRRDCEDDVEMVAGIIEACVRPEDGVHEK